MIGEEEEIYRRRRRRRSKSKLIMCDYFWQRIMDQNNQQGDLTDIFRNSGISPDVDSWHLPLEPAAADPFGDPFVDMGGGPLLDECFFNSADVKASGGGKEQKSSFFSRMLQISPPEIPPLPLVDGGGLQISSSPRMQGIKRRKSQVKKVVCIPAPPAASGKTSGEVVPSDLWAWRKYGQKPIKGSPYPRGYYRCSSSKGCSARKQVERSRTDPNMLVITYTSEHNHPWPTQRNALAGSTRSQPSKGNNNASTSNNSPHNQNQPTNIKEEHKEYSTSAIKLVKEEEAQDFDPVFDESFMMSNSSHPDDFFADLAELESDPMNLIFPKGLDEDRERNKVMDPFNMFDWEEAKRGL